MRETGFWLLMQKSLHAKDGKAKKNLQGPFIVRSLYPKRIIELQNEKKTCVVISAHVFQT